MIGDWEAARGRLGAILGEAHHRSVRVVNSDDWFECFRLADLRLSRGEVQCVCKLPYAQPYHFQGPLEACQGDCRLST